MTKPKYQIGDVINGWEIIKVFRYDYYPGWVYSLARSLGKSNMCLSIDESGLHNLLVTKSA